MKVTIEIIGQAKRMRDSKDGLDSNVRLYAAYDFLDGFSYEDACGP